MKTILKLTAFLLILAGSFSSCEDTPKEQACNVSNPLTDLPWLKAIVDEYGEGAKIDNILPYARIYQCSYKGGTGFLLEMCVACPDFGYSFRNCEGEVLCGGGGFSGEDTCPEFKIDYDNKKLIWEI